MLIVDKNKSDMKLQTHFFIQPCHFLKNKDRASLGGNLGGIHTSAHTDSTFALLVSLWYFYWIFFAAFTVYLGSCGNLWSTNITFLL